MTAMPVAEAAPVESLISSIEEWERYVRAHRIERSELINGRVIELMPPKRRHGKIATRLAARLEPFVTAAGLGEVTVETGYVLKTQPMTVRGPDVAFIAASQISSDMGEEDYYSLAPTLAVEIVSPGDTEKNVNDKVNLYLEAGTEEVWVVRGKAKTVTIHSPNFTPVTYGVPQTLSSGHILPGFSLPVAEIFE